MVKKRFGVILAIMLIVNCFSAVGSYAEEARDNIALFSYSGGTAKADMTEGDKASGYPATGGAAKSSPLLFASVSGTKNSAMVWSKAEYTYGGSSKAVVPLMAASADDLWGDAPYFLIKTSTKGYENIRFSARISGTNKGPRDYSLQYSTDGTAFINITSASVSGNKNLDNNQIFADVIIPEAAADSAEVYFKIIAASTTTIGETDFEGQFGGKVAINDIAITGTAVSGTIPTLETPSANAADGEIYSNEAIELTAIDGASIFCSTDGTTFNIYTEPLYLFKDIADESVTLKVYASKEGDNDSAVGTYTYTCVSDEIAGFSFNSADSIEYVNGMIKATSGIYNDAKMTASIDTVNKYVPMFDAEMNAAVIAPDDSIAWSDGTYWQFELSTMGYNRIYISGAPEMLKLRICGTTVIKAEKTEQCKSGEMTYLDSTKRIGNYFLDNSVKVFLYNGGKGDDNITSGAYYDAVDYTFLKDKERYSADIFDVKNYFLPSAILVYYADRHELEQNYSIMLVKKINTLLNKDNSEIYTVDGYLNGTETTIEFSENVQTIPQAGDIIQYRLNSDGTVEDWRKVCDKDSEQFEKNTVFDDLFIAKYDSVEEVNNGIITVNFEVGV